MTKNRNTTIYFSFILILLLLLLANSLYSQDKNTELYGGFGLGYIENNQDIFFAEPTNVYENVEGGIGIFTLNTRDEYVIEF